MIFQPAWMPPLLTGFPINFFFQFNVNRRLENREVFHSTLRLKFDGGLEKLNCSPLIYLTMQKNNYQQRIRKQLLKLFLQIDVNRVGKKFNSLNIVY